MSTTLDDMRAIVRDQQQAEADAREASRIQAERDKDFAFLAACEKLGQFIPESVLDGRWTVHREVKGYTHRMTSGHDADLVLRSGFLPDDVDQLVLLGRWVTLRADNADSLFLQRPGISSDLYIRLGMSAEEVMGLLAPLVVEYVEEIETSRELQQRRERFEVAQQARQERIDGKLAEMEALYTRAIRLDLDRIAAAWGFPERRTVMAYHIEWTVGIDSEGNVEKASAWSLMPDPDEDGFYDILTRNALVRRRIASPCIVVTERVWGSISDVPVALTEMVRRDRCLRVYEWKSDGKLDWIGQRQIGDSRRVPGPCLRSQMGYVETEIPADPLPRASSAGMPLVPTLMTAEGFEPVDVEEADDAEELPY